MTREIRGRLSTLQPSDAADRRCARDAVFVCFTVTAVRRHSAAMPAEG